MNKPRRSPRPQGHFDVVLHLACAITAALNARTKSESDRILIDANTNAQTFYLTEMQPHVDYNVIR